MFDLPLAVADYLLDIIQVLSRTVHIAPYYLATVLLIPSCLRK